MKTSEQLAAEAKLKYGSSFKVGDMKGENITLDRGEVNGREVSVMNVVDCSVKLHGSPSTVYICNCVNSTFEIGPVSGSVFVERWDFCMKIF